MDENKKTRRRTYWKSFFTFAVGYIIGEKLIEFINIGKYINNGVGKFALEVLIMVLCMFCVERIVDLIHRLFVKE